MAAGMGGDGGAGQGAHPLESRRELLRLDLGEAARADDRVLVLQVDRRAQVVVVVVHTAAAFLLTEEQAARGAVSIEVEGLVDALVDVVGEADGRGIAAAEEDCRVLLRQGGERHKDDQEEGVHEAA